MADVSMCAGVECDRRHQCYYHMAKPNTHRQSIMIGNRCTDERSSFSDAGAVGLMTIAEADNYWLSVQLSWRTEPST